MMVVETENLQSIVDVGMSFQMVICMELIF